jgi:two-component system chemotaxis response regulator CheY
MEFAALKILVADDFVTMRRIVKNLLRDLGVNTIKEAEDGEKALQMLLADSYDVAIVDHNMPKMGGLALLTAMQQKPQLCQLPVILLVAEPKRNILVEAAFAGARAYLVKPFTSEHLQAKLEALLRK